MPIKHIYMPPRHCLSGIFGRSQTAFGWFFLAKVINFYSLGFGKSFGDANLANNATKDSCQCKCIEYQQWKAKKRSHKPTDGNIDHQPRFVTQTAFNTEHLNQFPIIEYRQEANTKIWFSTFLEPNSSLSPSLVCHIDTWVLLQMSLSTCQTVTVATC